MNIVIVGQGAIGQLWYCKLAQQGIHNLSLYCSSRVTRTPGSVSLLDHKQRHHNFPLNIANNHCIEQADLLIFCVKAYDVIKAVNELYPQLSRSVPLILCHNGIIDISAIDDLVKHNHPLITLLTTHGAKKESDFQVKHTGVGNCQLGYSCSKLPQDYANARLTDIAIKTLTEQLDQAFSKVTWCFDIIEKQWLKLLINCVINPITAIENIDNGLITSPRFDQKIDAIIAELIIIANQQNILFTATQLKQIVLQVAQSTAKNSSSMRCDLECNRSTEIEQINGYIVQLGKRHGVNTPVNQALYKHIKQLEKNL